MITNHDFWTFRVWLYEIETWFRNILWLHRKDSGESYSENKEIMILDGASARGRAARHFPGNYSDSRPKINRTIWIVWAILSHCCGRLIRLLQRLCAGVKAKVFLMMWSIGTSARCPLQHRGYRGQWEDKMSLLAEEESRIMMSPKQKNLLAIIMRFKSTFRQLLSLRVWYHIWSMKSLCDFPIWEMLAMTYRSRSQGIIGWSYNNRFPAVECNNDEIQDIKILYFPHFLFDIISGR
jgi:hypothetical protein